MHQQSRPSSTCKTAPHLRADRAQRVPHPLLRQTLRGLLSLLFALLVVAFRMGARRRPGLLIGLFLTGYGSARMVVENFREPDAQLGFLFAEVTMGQLLSLPMVVVGVWLIRRAITATAPI